MSDVLKAAIEAINARLGDDGFDGSIKVEIEGEGALGIDVVENTEQAFEAAKAFGEFQCQLAGLPVRLNETIPDFHHTKKQLTM